MARISEVPGITGSTLELLEAAGFGEARDLLGMRVPEIFAKLHEVNRTYHLAERLPSQTALMAWQSAARILERGDEGLAGRGRFPRANRGEVGLAATIVPEEDLLAAGIDLDAIPVVREGERGGGGDRSQNTAEELHEAGFDMQVSGDEAPPDPPDSEAAPAPDEIPDNPEADHPVGESVDETPPRIPGHLPESSDFRDQHRVRPVAELEAGGDPGAETGEVNPNRFRNLEEELRTKDQGQRRNRGMLHPDPLRVWIGAVVTLLMPTLCILAALGLIAALILAQFTDWEMPGWAVWVPVVFPAAGLAYLVWGIRPRCRLCGQRLFVPKHCRPHVRANRSVFGYTIAMAGSIVLRSSFRCLFCGTKMRLRK